MRFIKFMLAAVIAIGIVVAIAVNVPAVQDRLVDQAIRDNVDNRARIAKLFADDALRLVVCGSSSPLPSPDRARPCLAVRSEEHTSELQSLMRISYDVFCLKKKTASYKRTKNNEYTSPASNKTKYTRRKRLQSYSKGQL